MKKFLVLVISLLVLTACNIGGGLVTPNPQLTLSVSKDTVSPGETITITVSTQFADGTSNNIGAPTTTSWTYSMIVNSRTVITVSAFNESGNVQKNATIEILPQPNRTDTISSMSWKEISDITRDRYGNIIFNTELTQEQLSIKYYFYKNGTLGSMGSDGILYSGQGSWSWKGSDSILIGSRTYRYIMTGTNLYLYSQNNDGSQITCKTYAGTKI